MHHLKLKDERIAAGLSIEEVAARLNIRKRYIVAMEEGDWQAIPGKVYIEGYLKLYTKYLGIKVDLLVDEPKVHHKQIKIHVRQGVKKYLVVLAGLMLTITIYTYNWIINEASTINGWSEISNTGFNNVE